MSEILQLGSIGRTIIKVIVACMILRVIMKAIDLPIFDYVPIIDDLVNLIFAILFALAQGLEKAASTVVAM